MDHRFDRRLTPATDRVAHVSLRGRLERPRFTEGEPLRVSVTLADLLRAPFGARERQLWLGERFIVVDRDQGHAFGFAEKDGYCGWLPETALADAPAPTHWVASPGTHLYPEPRSVSRELAALPTGAGLAVLGRVDKWAETTQGFVPFRHLRPVGDFLPDPVAVAEGFLGAPYLWGGDSRAGLDCSGLAHVAFHACGAQIPRDSDLQFDALSPIQREEARRGDLVFWKGHVAILTGPGRIIHANGFTMSVAYEGLQEAIARILPAEGEVLGWRRAMVGL
jgi:cell wall-associated NlpC family hydrolase